MVGRLCRCSVGLCGRACEVCAGSGALTLPVLHRSSSRRSAEACSFAVRSFFSMVGRCCTAVGPSSSFSSPSPARASRCTGPPWGAAVGRSGWHRPLTVILAVTGAAAVLAPQIPACDAAICTTFAASPCHKLSGCVPDFRPSNEEAEGQVYRPPAAGAPNAPRAASAPLFWPSATSCLRCRLITMPYFTWLADRSIKVHSTLIAHPD